MNNIRSTNPMIGTGLKTLSKIEDGKAAYHLQLTNDSHTIPSDEQGNGEYTGCETLVVLYKGNKRLEGVKDIVDKPSTSSTKKLKYEYSYSEEDKAMKLVVKELHAPTAHVDFIYKVKGEGEAVLATYTARFSISKVVNGEDSFMMDLSNDNHTFISDENGKIDTETETSTNVRVYKGIKLCPVDSYTIDWNPSRIEGLSVERVSSKTDEIKIKALPGVNLIENGTINFHTKVNAPTEEDKDKKVDLYKTFSWAKTRYGLSAPSFELSNDSHIVPVDSVSGEANFKTCITKPNFYLGNRLETNPVDLVITCEVSKGLTYNKLGDGSYQVTGLGKDENEKPNTSGWIKFKATYKKTLELFATFTIVTRTNGRDVYMLQLTNDNHSFITDSNSMVHNQITVTTKPQIVKGIEDIDVTADNVKLYVNSNNSKVKARIVGTEVEIKVEANTKLEERQGIVEIKAEIEVPYEYDSSKTTKHTMKKEFTWTRVKEGKGFDTITEYFKASSLGMGETVPDPYEEDIETILTNKGWLKEPPETSESKKYLWNFERILHNEIENVDGETRQVITHTIPRVLGNHSLDGYNGHILNKVYNFYMATDVGDIEKYEGSDKDKFKFNEKTSIIVDSIEAADKYRNVKWTSYPQTVTETLKYLWNVEVLEYILDKPDSSATDKFKITTPTLKGVHGQRGKSVFVTYHGKYKSGDNEDATPPRPSGDGEGAGWSKTAQEDAVWMSQKVAYLVTESVEWSVPIRLLGPQGPQGPEGPHLDWIDDWDGETVIVDTEGKRIITPKLFVGKLEGTPSSWKEPGPKIPTGVALGTKMLGSNSEAVGLAGYNKGKVTFLLDTKGEFIVGDDSESGSGYLSFKNNKFEICADNISFKSSKQTIRDSIKDEVKDGIDGINIGGRNLLLKSGEKIRNSSYNIAVYKFGDEKLSEGEEFTIQLKGALGKGKTYFGIYNSGGSTHVLSLGSAHYKNGIYVATGKWRANSTNNSVYVYTLYSDVVTESNIDYIKIEKGNKATAWTPAPEDYDNSIDGINSKINDFSDDNKVTPVEKKSLYNIIADIKRKYTLIIRGAETYSINSKSYKDSYNTLIQYMENSSTGILAPKNMGNTTNIDRVDFRSKFDTFHKEEKNLITRIQEKIDEENKGKFNEFSDKQSTFENTLDGFNTTVSELKQKNETITNDLSKVTQTTDELSGKVSKTEVVLNQMTAGVRSGDIGLKINYSSLENRKNGSAYLHGFNKETQEPIVGGGKLTINGTKYDVKTGTITPSNYFGNDLTYLCTWNKGGNVVGIRYRADIKKWEIRGLLGHSNVTTEEKLQSGYICFGMFEMLNSSEFTFMTLIKDPIPITQAINLSQNIEIRMSKAEQKITADAIIGTITTRVDRESGIKTNSLVLDKEGVKVQNGKLYVQAVGEGKVFNALKFNDKGDMSLVGTFFHYRNNLRTLEIDDNGINFYNYTNPSGGLLSQSNFMGSIGTGVRVNKDSGRPAISNSNGINMYLEYDKCFSIHQRMPSGYSESFKRLIDIGVEGRPSANSENRARNPFHITVNGPTRVKEGYLHVEKGIHTPFISALKPGTGITNKDGDRYFDAIVIAHNRVLIQSLMDDKKEVKECFRVGKKQGFNNMAFEFKDRNGKLYFYRDDVDTSEPAIKCIDAFRVAKNLYVGGQLVSPKSTLHYGERSLYGISDCENYVTDRSMKTFTVERTDNGTFERVVLLDNIFKEIARTDIDYSVEILKQGWGDYRVKEQNENYFIVESNREDFTFKYIVTARVRGEEDYRLREIFDTNLEE